MAKAPADAFLGVGLFRVTWFHSAWRSLTAGSARTQIRPPDSCCPSKPPNRWSRSGCQSLTASGWVWKLSASLERSSAQCHRIAGRSRSRRRWASCSMSGGACCIPDGGASNERVEMCWPGCCRSDFCFHIFNVVLLLQDGSDLRATTAVVSQLPALHQLLYFSSIVPPQEAPVTDGQSVGRGGRCSAQSGRKRGGGPVPVNTLRRWLMKRLEETPPAPSSCSCDLWSHFANNYHPFVPAVKTRNLTLEEQTCWEERGVQHKISAAKWCRFVYSDEAFCSGFYWNQILLLIFGLRGKTHQFSLSDQKWSLV